MKKLLLLLLLTILVFSCNEKQKKLVVLPIEEPEIIEQYGFTFSDYVIINDTIKSGESFGQILDRHHVYYPEINKIATSIKDVFDVRRVKAGIPYTILASKDSTEAAKVFIYKNDKIRATVVNFQDKIEAYTYIQPIKTVEKIVEGKIYSNLSNAMDSLKLRPNLIFAISDIYAWTLDFYKLQEGDKFKFVYEEKYINDTTFAGYGKVKAAVFTHRNQEFYAYRFLSDSIKGIHEYYDEKGDMLRSQFLKSPIKFQYRISSRYNLKRRIAHYGYKIKPHKGTDFAAANGTPIMATANGTVIASEKRGGNGNYVKVKHNGTFTTQYLHMSRRKSKVGDFVKQGDVIGYVGSTGSSSGNHVCYRFWKNNKQVDPLDPKLNLPGAEPLKQGLRKEYFSFIAPLKLQLDNKIRKKLVMNPATFIAKN